MTKKHPDTAKSIIHFQCLFCPHQMEQTYVVSSPRNSCHKQFLVLLATLPRNVFLCRWTTEKSHAEPNLVNEVLSSVTIEALCTEQLLSCKIHNARPFRFPIRIPNHGSRCQFQNLFLNGDSSLI